MPTPPIDTLTWCKCDMTARPDHPRSALTRIDVLDVTAGKAGASATMFLFDRGVARTQSPA